MTECETSAIPKDLWEPPLADKPFLVGWFSAVHDRLVLREQRGPWTQTHETAQGQVESAIQQAKASTSARSETAKAAESLLFQGELTQAQKALIDLACYVVNSVIAPSTDQSRQLDEVGEAEEIVAALTAQKAS